MERDDVLKLPANNAESWNTRSAIERLCTFAEEMLQRDYDGHGWEELREAANVVRQALAGGSHPCTYRGKWQRH